MAKQLQVRRGTTMANNLFTGAEGEITMDTETKGLRIHDGSKAGGFRVPTLVAVQYPSAANNYIWYRKYSDGWVEQGGVGVLSLTVTLPVTMSDANYTITTACDNYSPNAGTPVAVYYDKTATGFTLQGRWNGNAQGGMSVSWEVKGLAA